MTDGWRRWAALIATMAAGLLLAMAGTASADGNDHHPQCAVGEANGDGTTVLPGGVVAVDDFAFDVCQNGDQPTDVTGYFAATPASIPGGVPAPQGPVVCAVFDGHSVTFLYTLNEKSNPPELAGTQVLVVATDGEPQGEGDTIGFFGPAPAATFGQGCDPTSPQAVAAAATALPVGAGDISVHDKI